MKFSCIVCGEELTSVRYVGRIKDMEVSFCERDIKTCNKCENVSCVFSGIKVQEKVYIRLEKL